MKKNITRTQEQREAARIAARKWRAAHQEQARERGRQWYTANRKRERKKQLAKRLADPEKKREADRKSYQRHRPSRLAQQKAYYYANREARLLAQICRNHGLTIEQYRALGSVCAICGTTRSTGPKSRLHVDHCHESGRIRGMLCSTCNIGLGVFRHSPELLAKAIEFLRER